MDRLQSARNCLKSFNQPYALLFLFLLLVGDLAFLALHFVNALLLDVPNPMLKIDHENGYAEMYQYVKFFWIVVLLIYVAVENRTLDYVSLILFFTYFLFDDSLRIHERAGRYVAAELGFLPFLGLRSRDFGELAVSAGAGVILFSILLWTYRNGSQTFKKIAQDMVLLILVLVFFGVFIDMMHEAISLGGTVSVILMLVEDGGEMVAVSFMLWYAFLLKVRGVIADCYLGDLVRLALLKRRV